MFFFGDFQGTNNSQGTAENIQTMSAADLTGNVSDGEWQLAGKPGKSPTPVVGTGWASLLTNRLASATGQTVTAGEPYDYLSTSINPNTHAAYGSACTSTANCVFPGSMIPESCMGSCRSEFVQISPCSKFHATVQ